MLVRAHKPLKQFQARTMKNSIMDLLSSKESYMKTKPALTTTKQVAQISDSWLFTKLTVSMMSMAF